jgi:hypothetical protein
MLENKQSLPVGYVPVAAYGGCLKNLKDLKWTVAGNLGVAVSYERGTPVASGLPLLLGFPLGPLCSSPL